MKNDDCKQKMMKDDNFKLLRCFDDGRTAFVNVELLLQLKNYETLRIL